MIRRRSKRRAAELAAEQEVRDARDTAVLQSALRDAVPPHRHHGGVGNSAAKRTDPTEPNGTH